MYGQCKDDINKNNEGLKKFCLGDFQQCRATAYGHLAGSNLKDRFTQKMKINVSYSPMWNVR